VLACLLGAALLRLRGHYFAIASLSLIEVFRELVNNATDLIFHDLISHLINR
jgi:branched-chain amino acid transport system permease protein